MNITDPDNYVRINIQIPETDLAALRNHASTNGRTLPAEVRLAIRDWIGGLGPREHPLLSAAPAVRARHVMGLISGDRRCKRCGTTDETAPCGAPK